MSAYQGRHQAKLSNQVSQANFSQSYTSLVSQSGAQQGNAKPVILKACFDRWSAAGSGVCRDRHHFSRSRMRFCSSYDGSRWSLPYWAAISSRATMRYKHRVHGRVMRVLRGIGLL